MTELDIKSVVKATVNELLADDMIKYSDLIIYNNVGEMLRNYYNSGCTDKLIAGALIQLSDHPYFDVLEMYYGNGMTLEQIAEDYSVDISTIVRNKKSLCIKIFELIN